MLSFSTSSASTGLVPCWSGCRKSKECAYWTVWELIESVVVFWCVWLDAAVGLLHSIQPVRLFCTLIFLRFSVIFSGLIFANELWIGTDFLSIYLSLVVLSNCGVFSMSHWWKMARAVWRSVPMLQVECGGSKIVQLFVCCHSAFVPWWRKGVELL